VAEIGLTRQFRVPHFLHALISLSPEIRESDRERTVDVGNVNEYVRNLISVSATRSHGVMPFARSIRRFYTKQRKLTDPRIKSTIDRLNPGLIIRSIGLPGDRGDLLRRVGHERYGRKTGFLQKYRCDESSQRWRSPGKQMMCSAASISLIILRYQIAQSRAI